MILRGLLVIGVAYAVVVALMWVFQERLLYQAGFMTDQVATPAEAGLEWEPVALRTSDDLTLDAWWLPQGQERATLLFFHGNAGNISHRLPLLELFNRLGLSVLIIDYRGYGRSDGQPSEAGTALDARAAWQWLREEQRREAGDIVVHGRSLGAAVAAELAREVTPGAVILESPFRSVPLLASRIYPFLPARWLVRFDYATQDYVRDIAAPVLVIHSREDEIIPFEEGEAVYRAASEPKEMLVIEGGHNTGFRVSEQTYLDGIDQFLFRDQDQIGE